MPDSRPGIESERCPDIPRLLAAAVAQPKAVLIFLAVASIVAILALFDLESGRFLLRVDPAVTALLSHRDEDLAYYREVRDAFGAEDAVVVGAAADAVFSKNQLDRLNDVHKALSELPFVSRTLSLSNAIDPRATEDGVALARFLSPVPSDPEALVALRERSLSHPLYARSLVANHGEAVAFLVHVPDVDDSAFLENRVDKRIFDVVRKGWGNDSVWLSGLPMIKASTSLLMSEDLSILIPLGFVVGSVVFFCVFRTLCAIWLPTVSIALGLLWTVAVMTALGHPLNLITMIIPVLIISIGYTYLMHLLSDHESALRTRAPGESGGQTVARSLGRVWTPIVMTALSTAAGFLSLTTSPLESVREFGLFSAVGVVFATVATVLLSSAVLGLRRNDEARPRTSETNFVEKATLCIAEFDRRNGSAILVAAGLIAVLSCLGAARITVDMDTVENFEPDAAPRLNFERISTWFGGAIPFYLVLESTNPGAFKQQETLRHLQDLQRWLEEQPEIGETSSLAEIVTSLYQAFDGAKSEGDLPVDPNLTAQLLLLVDDSDLEPFVDADYRRATILVRSKVGSSARLSDLLDRIEEQLRGLPASLDGQLTGDAILIGDAIDSISQSQSTVLPVAFVAIYAMLALYLRSARLGLLSLVPNALPVLFYFGLLGWSGVTLNHSTSLMACIVIGIAVDDTVHYIARFRRESERLGDVKLATNEALRTVGRPITYTTLILILSFLLIASSRLQTLSDFGALGAVALFFAWLVDVTLTPVLCARTGLGAVGIRDRVTGDVGERSPTSPLRPWLGRGVRILGASRGQPPAGPNAPQESKHLTTSLAPAPSEQEGKP